MSQIALFVLLVFADHDLILSQDLLSIHAESWLPPLGYLLSFVSSYGLRIQQLGAGSTPLPHFVFALHPPVQSRHEIKEYTLLHFGPSKCRSRCGVINLGHFSGYQCL